LVREDFDAVLAQQLGGNAAAGFGAAVEGTVVNSLTAARRAAVGQQGETAAVAASGFQRQLGTEQVLCGDIIAAGFHHLRPLRDYCRAVGVRRDFR